MRGHLKLALLIWLFVQVVMYVTFGIRHGGDTARYLGAGEGLTQGIWPTGKEASYIGYDALVAANLALGLGERGIVGGQLLLSLLATVSMYGLGKRLYSERVGLIASSLFAAMLKLHPWNFYILTDSLTISLVPITAYLLASATTWPRRAAALTAVAGAVTLRLEGIIFAFAAAVWFIVHRWRRQRFLTVAAVVILAAASTPTLWRTGGRFASHEQLLQHYRVGAVIWNFEPLYLPHPPRDDAVYPEHALGAIGLFMVRHPAYVARLALTKVWYELIHVRPFHDAAHNLLILMTMIPMYGFFMQGAAQPVRDRATWYYLLGLLAAKMVIVALTFADWSGRFLLHVYPTILILAAPSLARVFTRVRWPRFGLRTT